MSQKLLSKTQLLRQAQARDSPYKRGPESAGRRRGGQKRLDTNDYTYKYAHGPLWIRDAERPFLLYHTTYEPDLELFLFQQAQAAGAEEPPRFSSIRTTTHPTHRMLGSDVKTFHLLKDSGFRYQEKFPHCIRLCLDGMGKTGSSNRPYALSRRDFQHHFDSISLAHRGHKKAKLCLYEQASHRPRVDWLKQLVSLVFEEKDIDATRYEVREMVWNGHELIDPSGHPQRTQPPAENSLSTLQPTHSSLLRCEETLSTSSSDELSDTETEVQESSQDSNPSYHHLQPLASRVWSMHPPAPESQDTLMADFDDEVEQDREFLAPLVSNHFPRGFSSLPSSSSSFALPLMASPNVAASPMRASFSNFGAANYQMNLNVGFTFSPSMLRRQSSNPSATATPLMQAHGIAMSPFLNENSLDQPAQPLASHSEARLGSIGFGWLNSRTESITNDTALFFEQHGGSALGGPTRGDSCLAQGTLSRINSGAEYFP